MRFIHRAFLRLISGQAVDAILQVRLLLRFVTRTRVGLLDPYTFLRTGNTKEMTSVGIIRVRLTIIWPFAREATDSQFIRFLPNFPRTLRNTQYIFYEHNQRHMFIAFRTSSVQRRRNIVHDRHAAQFNSCHQV